MAAKFLISLVLLAVTLLLDRLVRPRPAGHGLLAVRSACGSWLHFLVVFAVFGAVMALCGNPLAAACVALAFVGLFVMVSNAKRAMLGEPLVFSDLALFGAVFRHPQFYMSALTAVQKAVLLAAVPVLPGLLWWVFLPDIRLHLAGVLIVMTASALLGWTLQSRRLRVTTPDAEADLLRHGLLAMLLLHWRQWRGTADPLPVPGLTYPARPGEVAVIIQCESFADPCALFGDASLELPGLAAMRGLAWQHGDLQVHGFGAYTMRTEYGLLFGRSEEELGFRRFDPFLTALGESSYALPARLAGAGWRSIFAHPHDMRFYNRENIMRAAGFAELVGEERFAPPSLDEGRYVTDAAMADEILRLVNAAQDPALFYAVTIENHGPWQAGKGSPDLQESYLRLVRNSDAMLTTLHEGLASSGRPATLVFFGDHRPSIPGICVPGGDRHTPYLIVRYDASGQVVRGEGRRCDLTPAGLHHTLLDLLSGRAA